VKLYLLTYSLGAVLYLGLCGIYGFAILGGVFWAGQVILGWYTRPTGYTEGSEILRVDDPLDRAASQHLEKWHRWGFILGTVVGAIYWLTQP
jgi:hypothetical protein